MLRKGPKLLGAARWHFWGNVGSVTLCGMNSVYVNLSSVTRSEFYFLRDPY